VGDVKQAEISINGDPMLDLIVFDANDVQVCNKTDLGNVKKCRLDARWGPFRAEVHNRGWAMPILYSFQVNAR
jgi:hypothetical protein